MEFNMNGLNILQIYSTVKYSELPDRVIATTKGGIAHVDGAKLVEAGWIKITDSEYHWLKPKKEEPEMDPSTADTDLFIE